MIWCLHGFLGQASDWDPFLEALGRMGFPEVRRPDLFSHPPDDRDLVQWGAAFAREVEAADPDPVVVGYSLGGRLALHACLARPGLWKAAVLVSAHPGLSNADERAARLEHDAAWARRFETEAWAPLMRAWNGQAVFGTRGPSLEQPEAAWSRAALAGALRTWSLGAQKNLLSSLGSLSFPVLWLAGAQDHRFARLGAAAVQHLPAGTLHIVEGSAHRVPWEAPGSFLRQVERFLSNCGIQE